MKKCVIVLNANATHSHLELYHIFPTCQSFICKINILMRTIIAMLQKFYLYAKTEPSQKSSVLYLFLLMILK